MRTNSDLTHYQKSFDYETRQEVWTRFYYPKVWQFGGSDANLNTGLEEKYSLKVRIPYDENNIQKISTGDLIVIGLSEVDIKSKEDLKESFTVLSVVDNTYGLNAHIHLKAE